VTGTGKLQAYAFDLSDFEGPLASINFVVDEVGVTEYTVMVNGLSYAYPVTGTEYKPESISALPLTPVVTSAPGTTTGGSNTAKIEITQTDTKTGGFSARSTITDKRDFTFSSISWGYFDKDHNNAFVGIGAPIGTSVTLGIQVTDGRVLKVEFVNTKGVKKVFAVTGTGKLQAYAFDLSDFEGPLASINFVVDEVGVTEYTVMVNGLSYIPTIPPGGFGVTISPLPGSPIVSWNVGSTVGGTEKATMDVSRTGTTTVTVDAKVPVKGTFAFLTFGWGYFDKANVFHGTGADLGKSVTFGLSAIKGSEGRKVKIEVVSALDPNKKQAVYVNLQGPGWFYTVDLPDGFGPVAYINFVVDEVGETAFTIGTAGLSYTPPVAGVPFAQSPVSTLPGKPAVAATVGTVTGFRKGGTANFVPLSRNTVKFSSTLTEGNFSLGQFSWGYFDEYNRFQGTGGAITGNSMTFGLSGTPGTVLKVEFVTTTGQRLVYQVTLTGTPMGYTFDLTQLQGQLLAGIYFVDDTPGQTEYTVVAEGFDYRPIVQGTAYNAAQLTDLQGPDLVVGSGSVSGLSTANIYATPTLVSGITVVKASSNVSSPGSFTFSIASYGDFYGSRYFTGSSKKIGKNVTLALQASDKASAGRRLKVEIVSTKSPDDKEVFWVILTEDLKNYTFERSEDVPVSAIVLVDDSYDEQGNFVRTSTTQYTFMANRLSFDPTKTYQSEDPESNPPTPPLPPLPVIPPEPRAVVGGTQGNVTPKTASAPAATQPTSMSVEEGRFGYLNLRNDLDILGVTVDPNGQLTAQDRFGKSLPVNDAYSVVEYATNDGRRAVFGIPGELFTGMNLTPDNPVTVTLGVPGDTVSGMARVGNLPAFFVIHHADGKISLQDSQAHFIKSDINETGQIRFWYDMSLTLSNDAVSIEGIGDAQGTLTSRIWNVVRGQDGGMTLVPAEEQKPMHLIPQQVAIHNVLNVKGVTVNEKGEVNVFDAFGRNLPLNKASSSIEFPLQGGGTAVTGISPDLFKGKDLVTGRTETVTIEVPIDFSNRVRVGDLPAFYVITHTDGRVSIQDSQVQFKGRGAGNTYQYDISLTLPADAVRVEFVGLFIEGALTSRIFNVTHNPSDPNILRLAPAGDQRPANRSEVRETNRRGFLKAGFKGGLFTLGAVAVRGSILEGAANFVAPSLSGDITEIHNVLEIARVAVDPITRKILVENKAGAVLPFDNALSVIEYPSRARGRGEGTVLAGIFDGLYQGVKFTQDQAVTMKFGIPEDPTNPVQVGNIPAFFIIWCQNPQTAGPSRVVIRDSQARYSEPPSGGTERGRRTNWYEFTLNLPADATEVIAVGSPRGQAALTGTRWNVERDNSDNRMRLEPASTQKPVQFASPKTTPIRNITFITGVTEHKGELYVQEELMSTGVYPVRNAYSGYEIGSFLGYPEGEIVMSGIPADLFSGKSFTPGRKETVAFHVPIDGPGYREREGNLPGLFVFYDKDGGILEIQDSEAGFGPALAAGNNPRQVSLTLPEGAVRVEGIATQHGEFLTSRIWDVRSTPFGTILVPAPGQKPVHLFPQAVEIHNNMYVRKVFLDSNGEITAQPLENEAVRLPVSHAFSAYEFPRSGGGTTVVSIPPEGFEGVDITPNRPVTVTIGAHIDPFNRVRVGEVPAFLAVHLSNGKTVIQDSEAVVSAVFIEGGRYPYNVTFTLPPDAVSVEFVGYQYSPAVLISLICKVVKMPGGEVMKLVPVPAAEQRPAQLLEGRTHTASNPDFYYVVNGATPPASSQNYYNVFNAEGFVVQLTKQTADIQGNYINSISVPDASPDGQRVILGFLGQRMYTGHTVQTLQVQVYDVAKRSSIEILLNEMDNAPIPPDRIPSEIRFAEGSSNVIRVAYANGNVEFYDAVTGNVSRSEVRAEQAGADRSQQRIARTVAVVRQLDPLKITEVREARLGFRPEDLQKIEKMAEGTDVDAELLATVLVAVLAGGIAAPEITAKQMAAVLSVVAKAQETPLLVLVQQVRNLLNVKDEEGLLIQGMDPGTAIQEADLVALANTKQHMFAVWTADAGNKNALEAKARATEARLLKTRSAKDLAIQGRFNIVVVDRAKPMAGLSKLIQQKKAKMPAISRGQQRYVLMGDLAFLDQFDRDTVQGLMIRQPQGKELRERMAASILGARVSQEILKVTGASEIDEVVARTLERQGTKGFYSFRSDALNAVLAVAMQALQAIRSAA
jgi:hypothetical protein